MQKHYPNLHELRHTFYTRYLVFNLRLNSNQCIIFFVWLISTRIQRLFSRYYFTSFFIHVYFLEISWSQILEKGYKNVNFPALQRFVLNSLVLLIKTSSVDNGNIKVCKIYNQACFQKSVFNVLKHVFKDFDLDKTFQLLELSFTYSVKDLRVYDYFSNNYGHFVNHKWQRFFLPRIWKNTNKVLG